MKNIRISGYDFTLLEFEGNDCDFNWSAIAADPGLRHLPNMPVTEFSMKYGRIVDRVREHGASPVILTLPPGLQRRRPQERAGLAGRHPRFHQGMA